MKAVVDPNTKTGTYRFVEGRLVKISDRVRSRRFLTCTCPSGGYFSENLGCFVRSRIHKRDILNRQGLEEVG